MVAEPPEVAGGGEEGYDDEEEGGDEDDGDGGNPAHPSTAAQHGVADETIATILESMDIGALNEKHDAAVKQSLLLAFLWLVVAAAAVMAAIVVLVSEVRLSALNSLT